MTDDVERIIKGLTKAQIEATSHLNDYQFGCWLLRYLHIYPAQQKGKTWLGQHVRQYLERNR